MSDLIRDDSKQDRDDGAKFNAPTKVTGLDVAFGGRMKELLPPYESIPIEFKRDSNPWARWQSSWFFSGLKRLPVPKPGIDRAVAMAHLAAIQGSFEPQHEHKMAGVAYLASLWFSSPDGDVPEKRK